MNRERRESILVGVCLFGIAACLFDYRKQKIPNVLIGMMIIYGVCWFYGREGVWGSTTFILRLLITGMLLYPLFQINTVGAGDVKLIAVSAGFLPFEKILFFFFYSMLIASGISIWKLKKEHVLKERIGMVLSYAKLVVTEGKLQNYQAMLGEKKAIKICLSGPVFVGLLLYMGGVY